MLVGVLLSVSSIVAADDTETELFVEGRRLEDVQRENGKRFQPGGLQGEYYTSGSVTRAKPELCDASLG
jgi:hypothetical protein